MVANRACKTLKDDGSPCRAPPLQDGDFCFAHSPDYAPEMQEARRLGGLRRRRERTVTSAYDVDGFGTIAQLQRVLEIVIIDGLGLENSPARGRLLIAAVLAGAKLREVGELEERLANVEAALGPRLQRARR